MQHTGYRSGDEGCYRNGGESMMSDMLPPMQPQRGLPPMRYCLHAKSNCLRGCSDLTCHDYKDNPLADLAYTSADRKRIMVEYLKLCLSDEDWHGVRDAAADLERMVAVEKALRAEGLAEGQRKPL